MAKIETGSEAPEFDLEVDGDERVRLRDFRDRRNVLLVFHPYAWTPICEEEALDLQENLPAFESAETDVVLVSCDSPPTRAAWKKHLKLTYTLASDFWPHGEAARAYGVFDQDEGAPVRGTFLIDKQGVVVWSLVHEADSRRKELVSGPLAASGG
ncbi:MAG: redoxin domain-containing protein [Thermoleophilia bacterium]|nr:redoxin domain-containing protein [Thermoleophilia bacterium]